MTDRSQTVRVIFAGGGTGGHLYPAIAIADRLTELLKDKTGVEILFVGTKRGLEYRIREHLGYPLKIINVRGLVRSLTWKNLLVPFVLVGALIKASALLNEFRPDIVVGTGGYVAWPVLKAAVSKKIPTVLQEQNSFPGITTRRLAGKADRIYLGFAKAKEMLQSKGEVIITGNPVRRSILAGDRAEAMKRFKLDPDKKTILVIGGSQGARALNHAILACLEKKQLPQEYQLLWQTGKRDYKDVIASAGEKVKPHSLFPFENRMDLVYAAADLVISRAGALALAELEACRLAAILVPYPFAAGDHQRKNAEEFVRHGFAVMLDESELDRFDLLDKALGLFRSGRVQQMSTAMAEAGAGKKPAVDTIAEDIIAMIDNREKQEAQLGERG
ncbi:MAG: undecaprenyldiphospho-muramoylpentapeptide beta-N-acetylglucosaminyltransferase [Candidatus Zixiibacteriota bacterium]